MLLKSSGNYNSGFNFVPKNKFHIDKFGMIVSLTLFICACSENDSIKSTDSNKTITTISSRPMFPPKTPAGFISTVNTKSFSLKSQNTSPKSASINTFNNKKSPEWLTKYVDLLNKDPVKDSPESITEFEYKGKSVYYFSPSCCGKDGKLYDQNNNIICFVSKKKNNCSDFDLVKKYKKIVWQENRD